MNNIVLSIETLYLSMVLLIMGEGLKGLQFVNRRHVIWLLLIISILVNFIFRGFSVNSFFEAFIATSIAVFIYNIIKETKKFFGK